MKHSLLAVFGVGALLGAGCGIGVQGRPPVESPLPAEPAAARSADPLPLAPMRLGSSRLSALAVSTGALLPPFSPDTLDYTLSSINSLAPLSVTAAAQDATAQVTVNGRAAESGKPVSLQLSPREDLAVVVTGINAEPRTYRVHCLPATLPGFQISGPSAKAGAEPVLINAGSTLLVVDRTGTPLYYRQIAPMRALDFQQHLLPSGEIFYSYSAEDPFAPTKVQTWLMDRAFNDVGPLALLATGRHPAHPCDPHDFVVLGAEHHLMIAYVEEVVDLSGLDPKWSAAAHVYAAVVQEVDHGQVVFEWDSTDHPSLFKDSVDGNGFTGAAISDYVHLNSVQVDPRDENLILSLRHSDSVLKVDRHTGATLWTLGGRSDDFGLPRDRRFSHQHHARAQPDGSLTLFDNGNNQHQTRVLSFTLDEAQRRVSAFHVVYERPADQPQSTFMGSASTLGPDRTLIGWGGWASATVAPPSVSEVVAGEQVWSLSFATTTIFSYRALPLLAR